MRIFWGAVFRFLYFFLHRVKLKEGVTFLGARPSNPTEWIVSQDVRSEGHRVVTLHCHKKESSYDQQRSVFTSSSDSSEDFPVHILHNKYTRPAASLNIKKQIHTKLLSYQFINYINYVSHFRSYMKWCFGHWANISSTFTLKDKDLHPPLPICISHLLRGLGDSQDSSFASGLVCWSPTYKGKNAPLYHCSMELLFSYINQ